MSTGTGKGGDTKVGTPNASDGSDNKETAPSELMTEVTSLLKSLRVDSASAIQHSLKAMQMCKIQTGNYKTVLLDGGATHVLRQVRNEEEWSESIPVQVSLATGTTELRQSKWNGSLLTDSPCQTILPMASVTKLGYQVSWTAMCDHSSGSNKIADHYGSRVPNSRFGHREEVA